MIPLQTNEHTYTHIGTCPAKYRTFEKRTSEAVASVNDVSIRHTYISDNSFQTSAS